MSALSRMAPRMSGAMHLCALSAATQKTTRRGISWMAFEQLDPALYPPPPSLQTKRPVVDDPTAAAGGSTDHPVSLGATSASAAAAGTPISTARTIEALTSGRTISPSGLRTGPTPLSQVQKRPFAPRHAGARDSGIPSPPGDALGMNRSGAGRTATE